MRLMVITAKWVITATLSIWQHGLEQCAWGAVKHMQDWIDELNNFVRDSPAPHLQHGQSAGKVVRVAMHLHELVLHVNVGMHALRCRVATPRVSGVPYMGNVGSMVGLARWL